ncbi:MAG: hypothetical protein KAJ78_01910, partial [Acidobacteria bacterium]|nr:hypothetical protein [Acidobacteriota bacterium]
LQAHYTSYWRFAPVGDWTIWEYRLAYWFLLLFFLVFGTAYAINIGRRIGTLTGMDLAAIAGFVADSIFVILFSRLTSDLIQALLNENDG